MVARNSEAAAKIIARDLSLAPGISQPPRATSLLSDPSSSDETVISGHDHPGGDRTPSKAYDKPEAPNKGADSDNARDSNNTIISDISNPAQLKDGDIVGSYRIEKVLGRGAMGVVLLVVDEMLDRKAALKFIGFELAKNQNCRDRFVREGRILAKLSAHPNLVSVYSGGEWMGVPYFTMAYVKGLAFNEMLKIQSPIPLPIAVKAAKETALALNFVWKEAKLVHRDIKPANLMYDNEKELTVVTDFGLAKPEKEQFDSTLTSEGAILGTPDYIAPEQIRCVENLDLRADLYSLGCTLFHLLTGKAPYTGKSIGDLIAAHLKETVPEIKNQLSVCPNELNELLKQMMAKNRNDRPGTYDEVISRLDSILLKQRT
jgi:serine/threonine-protein kinase